MARNVVTEAKVLSFVASSAILDEFRTIDPNLNNLIKELIAKPDLWLSNPSLISVSSPPPSPASHFERIYRIRLEILRSKSNVDAIKNVIERPYSQMVDYCKSHPESFIWMAVFNCLEKSYTVFCGQIDHHLDVICVIVGDHIPEFAMLFRG